MVNRSSGKLANQCVCVGSSSFRLVGNTSRGRAVAADDTAAALRPRSLGNLMQFVMGISIIMSTQRYRHSELNSCGGNCTVLLHKQVRLNNMVQSSFGGWQIIRSATRNTV